eukprot:TRINITY_DN98481_c0_g1_i1.p1 TRINITY_DN98481_c0_g1~~TRINITY_DN98481_c0_g1_i1.p1  ORF type:complete len:683 (-),score=127.60 TRINITY_DN98481_c0_g1_i1:30-2078(-)
MSLQDSPIVDAKTVPGVPEGSDLETSKDAEKPKSTDVRPTLPSEDLIDSPNPRVRASLVSRFTERGLVVEKKLHWSHRLVIRSEGTIGSIWNAIATTLILYIATIFPYKLCFLDFSPSKPDDAVDPLGWQIIENALSNLFIVDLFINFFVSYYDKEGNEILDLRKIVVKYVCTVMFWVNFMACIPEQLANVIMGVVMGTEGSGEGGGEGANKALLILRLQRITRLARMLRLAKLAKLMQIGFVRKMAKLRGPRMMGLAAALLWSMHLMGCGWFLVAVLHEDKTETWIYSRGIEQAPPEEQWITSMYWVLTVFTSVGFGDIFPVTTAEVFFGSIVMVIGAVLNTVFLSEIINLLSTLDRRQVEIEQAIGTIQDLAQHTHLEEKLQFELEALARSKKGIGSAGVEMEDMNKLFNGTFLPKECESTLAEVVFSGKMLQNKMFHEVSLGIYTSQVSVPDRLVVFLASAAQEKYFEQSEFVFQASDLSSAIYMVLEGTFGYVHGEEDNQSPYALMGFNNYFGAYECLNDIDDRISSARCESKQGSVLMLPKRSFENVVHETCPGFELALRKLSWVHEFSRRRRMQEWSVFMPYKLLAALTIFVHWRSYKDRATLKHSTKVDGVAREIARKTLNGKKDDTRSILRYIEALKREALDTNAKLTILAAVVKQAQDFQMSCDERLKKKLLS